MYGYGKIKLCIVFGLALMLVSTGAVQLVGIASCEEEVRTPDGHGTGVVPILAGGDPLDYVVDGEEEPLTPPPEPGPKDILYTENFNHGGALPTGWATNTWGPTARPWTTASQGGPDYVAWADSVGAGVDVDEFLFMNTVSVDCTGFGYLELEFYLAYNWNDGDEFAAVYYSNSTAFPSFFPLQVWNTDTYGTQTIDISMNDGDPNLFIGFRYHGTNDQYVWVDDIVIRGTTYIDLVADSVSGSSSTVVGGQVNVDRTFSNTGSMTATAFNYGIYLSTDNIITTGDNLIYAQTVTLAAGASDSTPLVIFLSSTYVGHYYYGLIVDYTDVISENREGNNWVASAGTLTIDDAYEENDVLATAYDISMNEMQWLNTINGYGRQLDSDWYEIYITNNYVRLVVNCTFTHAEGDIDIAVYDAQGGWITSSASVTDNEYIDYILPVEGTVYIRVYYGNQGNEYNLWWDDLPHTFADLEAVSVSGPTAATEGGTVDIDRSIRNNGNQASGTFAQALYLSPDPTITPADTQLFYGLHASLGGGATSTGTVPGVALPPGTMGWYYYGLIADLDGDVSENNEYNNATASASAVLIDDHYEENDAMATAYAFPELNWLSNINGLGCQGDQDWYRVSMTPNYLHLEVQCLFSHAAGNIDIAVYDPLGALVASSTSITNDESINAVMPAAGTFYIVVYGVGWGNTYNLWWDDTNVPYVDVVATSVSGPGLVNPGTTITVDRSITNIGNTQANNTPYSLYISTNSIISTADTEISNRMLMTLPAGSTDTRGVDAFIPTGHLGWHYYGLIVNPMGAMVENNYSNNDVPSVGQVLVDDNYEDNDDIASAYAFNEQTWLQSVDDYGVQGDFDYYEIYMTSGFSHLVVDLQFLHGLGDIDLAVYNNTGALITTSTSVTDDEYIDFNLPTSGEFYYLLVYGANAGNFYDLWWDDLQPNKDIEAEFVAGDTYALAGSTVNVDLQFTNHGYSQTGVFSYGIYLSTDLTITTGDIQILENPIMLNAGETYADSLLVPLDPAILGWYYYGLIVDVYNDESEFDESNNAMAYGTIALIDDNYEENEDTASAYSVPEGVWLNTISGLGCQADADWYEFDVRPGFEHINITCLFDNAGGDLELYFYNSTGHFIAGGFSSTDNEYIEVTVPTSGIHHLLILGGSDGNTYDLRWNGIPPTIDLVATMVAGPAMCNEGDTIDVTRLMQNVGNTDSNPFTYELYLSTDNIITAADTLIYSMPRGPIAAGSMSLSDVSVALPAGMMGEYYYGLMVDTLDENSETNEGNNVVASLGTVFIDDAYEDNDDIGSPYDLRPFEGVWLNTVNGYGLQADDDLYMIGISPGYERIYLNVSFDHGAGDIDLEILDTGGKVVAGSYSSTDGEGIWTVLPGSGIYFIRVFYGNTGNLYNMIYQTDEPPDTATATGPISATPTNMDVVDITYTTQYNPGGVNLYYTTDTAPPYIWILAGPDIPADGSFIWTIPADGTYGWLAQSEEEDMPSYDDPPEAAPYVYDGTAPWVTATTPADGATGISTAPGTFTIQFNEDMVPIPEPLSNLPGVTWFWNSFTELEGTYGALNPATVYYVDLAGQGFIDMAYNLITGDEYFEFTTVAAVDINDAALSNDWILISFPNQIDGDPLVIIQDMMDDGAGGYVRWNIAQWFDPVTQEWKTTATFMPPSLRTFTYVNNTMAFWLHITDYGGDGLLNFGGAIAQSMDTVTLHFKAGWNLIGYPFPVVQAAFLTFGNLINIADAMCYDPLDPYRLRQFDWVIEDHEPGKGYWIYNLVDETVIWGCP